ncbi:MAG: 1,4-alpha-glucan branching protein domain-containing protein [Armatimonadota bacterium]|nr:DUF1957 domain-containing protein [bacterium]
MPDRPSLGSLMLVLHSHLPYVLCHGRTPHGTDWLSEAAAECYIPLLDALYDLVDEGVSPHITVGITPVLTEMLADPVFSYEFTMYLQDKTLAADRDEQSFRASGDEQMAGLATFWGAKFRGILRNFRVRYHKSITAAFKKLQDEGHIEIITSAATHGYFPLLSQDVSIQAQVKQGVQTYKRHYGTDPRGFWLPECAYRPRYSWAYPVAPDGTSPSPYLRKGVEEFLGENGIKYFMIESHLLTSSGVGYGKSDSHENSDGGIDTSDFGASVYADRFPALKGLWEQFSKSFTQSGGYDSKPRSIYQAHYIASRGEVAEPVAVFARDPKTGYQVWSSITGYPGDQNYLEFHKKHIPGGHKYHRVSGAGVELGDKMPYDPQVAQERVMEHAAHFVQAAKDILREECSRMGAKPVICSPYDAELFGHWWFEGVDWLKQVIRLAAADPEISLATGTTALAEHAAPEPIALPEGSWGEGGFHWVWLNNNTEWTWKLIYQAEERMRELSLVDDDGELYQRIIRQAARELFLLQASDWQFNITSTTSTDYADLRVNWHYNSFNRLADLADVVHSDHTPSEDEIDTLYYCEERDSLFPDIDPSWFTRVEHPAK